MKKTLVLLLSALALLPLSALDLSIGKDDVRIVQSPDGGYHLYIRKKGDVRSVLLTETTKDPSLRADNYAYRYLEWNSVNGDEKRLLDGGFIAPEKKIWSLIDSTPESDATFGSAYHIWIPYLITYGYEWSRHATVQVLDGTFLNIRAFAQPYGDYSGGFADNPFRLRLSQKKLAKAPPADAKYMANTVETFTDLTAQTGGELQYAKGPDDIVPLIAEILQPSSGRELDLVFVIDSTESMYDDITALRKLLQQSLAENLPAYPKWRVALVLYKDYFEDFLVKTACDFSGDLGKFNKSLSAFRVQGGRDLPEAVYEGLDGALSLAWAPGADRKIILIGDAPPHPKPRGRITKEKVFQQAQDKGVQVNAIILPHGSTY